MSTYIHFHIHLYLQNAYTHTHTHTYIHVCIYVHSCTHVHIVPRCTVTPRRRFRSQEIHRIYHDLGESGHRWRVLWEKLDQPFREEAVLSDLRVHVNVLHSRSTVELLVKGKMIGDAARMFSQPHHFDKFNYTTPAYCDYCSHVLWGLVKTGGCRCCV